MRQSPTSHRLSNLKVPSCDVDEATRCTVHRDLHLPCGRALFGETPGSQAVPGRTPTASHPGGAVRDTAAASSRL